MTNVQGALGSLACALALVGCQPPAQVAKTESKKDEATAPKKDEPAPKRDAELTLAKVRDDVPLGLTKFLGKPVADAQALLGEPPGKGMTRSSCVRYLPERVWFRCQYAMQRYPDPSGTFAWIELEFEDGAVSAVAYEGWKGGTGPVDPAPLLAAIGLELPEPPKVDTPADGVRLWSWFNPLARLKIGEHQYRVEMSVVGDDWARSKLAVILNEPLSEAQKAAILPVGGKKPDVAPTPTPTPTPPPT